MNPTEGDIGREGGLVGLNTNTWDYEGAFIHQSAMSIDGARRLMARLVEFEGEKKPLPLWNRALVRTGRCAFSSLDQSLNDRRKRQCRSSVPRVLPGYFPGRNPDHDDLFACPPELGACTRMSSRARRMYPHVLPSSAHVSACPPELGA
jgi:hypothetical protein